MASNAITRQKGRGRSLAFFVLSVALLLVWCAVIVWFSSGTADESQSLSDGVVYKLLAVLQPDFAQLAEAQQIEIIDAWSFPIRKLAHFSEYFVLSGLAVNALWRVRNTFPQLSGLSIARICIASVAFCALYACTDEFHQLFVDGRAGRLFDVGVDTAGAIACCLVFAVIRRVLSVRERTARQPRARERNSR